MQIETFQNNHNGVTYKGVRLVTPIEATVCTDNQAKVVFKGELSLEEMTGSWKFGQQFQIVLRGKPVRIQQRNPSEYQRIEIALPLNVGRLLLSEFLLNNEV